MTMRITESQLRRIIRQEVRALTEMPRRRPAMSPEEVDAAWAEHDKAVAARPADVMKQLKAKYPKAYRKVQSDGMEADLLSGLEDAYDAELHNGGGTLTLQIGAEVLRSLAGGDFDLPKYYDGPYDMYGNYPMPRNEARSLAEARGAAQVWALYSLSDGARNYFGLAAGVDDRDAIINAGEDPDARGYEEVRAELYDPQTHDLALGSMNLTDADAQKVASGRVDFIPRKERKTYSGSRDIYGYPTGRGRRG